MRHFLRRYIMKPVYFDDLISLCAELSTNENKLLPLCAAENVISPFSKIPLDTFLQEKYIMGGVINYQQDSNFVVVKTYIKYTSCYLSNANSYMVVNMLMLEHYQGLMLS